jgi:branched-subunit amino acid transport protein
MTAVHDVPYLVVTIGCVAAVSFLSRASFAFLPESVKLPPRVQRSLRHAPVCALAAIVAPAVFTDHGASAFHLNNYRRWAWLYSHCYGSPKPPRGLRSVRVGVGNSYV